MENNELDIELLELQESLAQDPTILKSLTKEQKSKLISHYSQLLSANKVENERLRKNLDNLRK